MRIKKMKVGEQMLSQVYRQIYSGQITKETTKERK